MQDDNGNVIERKYKLNTPMVRRVYAPGEEPVRAVRAQRSERRGASDNLSPPSSQR